MTTLNPDLTRIDRDKLQEGDIYLVAAYGMNFHADNERYGPDWTETHIWPNLPVRDPGYHPRWFLIRRPVFLKPGTFGTVTTLDGETLTGYVNQHRQFVHVDEDGKADQPGIHQNRVTSFVPLGSN